MPALRQPRLTRRGTREKAGDRAAVALRVVQAHVHAGPGGAPQQDLSPAHDARCALDRYNLGYSLEETAARLKSKSGRNVGASTIAGWLDAAQAH